MTTYYVDYEGGNDAATGTSFAQRRKTLNSVFAICSAGDDVRIMSSKGPYVVGNATWTWDSNVVVFDQVVGRLIDWANAAWTSGNISTHGTTVDHFRVGNASVWCDIANGDAFGRLIYKTLPATLDLSGFEQISAWVYNEVDLPDGGTGGGVSNLKIALCTDTVGATPVHFLEALYVGQQTTSTESVMALAVTDTGAPLNSAIRSVALYKTGTASGNITFNHIVATKNSASNSGLTAASVLCTNIDDITTFNFIKGFNEANVFLENLYYGNNGTFITNTFTTTLTAFSGGAGGGWEIGSGNTTAKVARSTTLTNPVIVRGGWNRTDMSTRTGHTIYDARGYGATGLDLDQMGGIVFDKVGWVRLNYAVRANNSSNVVFNNSIIAYGQFGNFVVQNVNNMFLCNSVVYTHGEFGSVIVNGGARRFVLNNVTIAGGHNGIVTAATNGVDNDLLIVNNVRTFATIGALVVRDVKTVKVNNCNIYRDTSASGPMRFHDCSDVEINDLKITRLGISANCVFFGDSTSVRGRTWFLAGGNTAISCNGTQGAGHVYVDGIRGLGLPNILNNFLVITGAGTTYHFSNADIITDKVISRYSDIPFQVHFDRFSNAVHNNAHFIINERGVISANNDTYINHRHAWHAKITDTSELRPLKMKIAEVWADSYVPMSVKARIKRANANVTSRLVLPSQIGQYDEVVSYCTDNSAAYQEVTISWMPETESAYEVFWETWGVPGGWATVDHITIPWQNASANFAPVLGAPGTITVSEDGYGIESTATTRTFMRTKDPLIKNKNVYWEISEYDDAAAGSSRAGVAVRSLPAFGQELGTDTRSLGRDVENMYFNNATLRDTLRVDDSDTFRFAYNGTTRQLWVGRVVSPTSIDWDGGADPSTGSGNVWIIPGSEKWYPALTSSDSGLQARWRTGRYGLLMKPPSGFEALEQWDGRRIDLGAGDLDPYVTGPRIGRSNSNLTAATNTGGSIIGTVHGAVTSKPLQGNVYIEWHVEDFDDALSENQIGIMTLPFNGGYSTYYTNDGDVFVNGGLSGVTIGSGFNPGDTIGLAYNYTSNQVWFAVNGLWINNGKPWEVSGNVGYVQNTDTAYTYLVFGMYDTGSIFHLRPRQTQWQFPCPYGYGQADDYYEGTTTSSNSNVEIFHLMGANNRPNVAYSFRKINAQYNGPLVRIRDGGNNQESDFSANSVGGVDTDAIASFLGSNTGYIVKWYDQMGNYDLAQDTLDWQPHYNVGAIGSSGAAMSHRRSSMTSGTHLWTQPSPNLNLAGDFTMFTYCNFRDSDSGQEKHVVSKRNTVGGEVGEFTFVITGLRQLYTKREGIDSSTTDGVTNQGTNLYVMTHSASTDYKLEAWRRYRTDANSTLLNGATNNSNLVVGSSMSPVKSNNWIGDMGELVIWTKGLHWTHRQMFQANANYYWNRLGS